MGSQTQADGFADFSDLPFDPAVAAARQARRILARAQRTSTRLHTRRAKAQAELASLLPPTIADGDTWHVISGGDVDSMSYMQHLLAGEALPRMLLSTWCMAMEDVAQIGAWLDAGTLTWCDAYTGEIFPSQYPDAHAALCDHVRRHRGRVCTFRNHSKVTLLGNHATGRYLVIESSANVNTNPRTEQTAITASADLFHFYADFFDGIKSYNANFPDWVPHGRPHA